MAILTDPPEWRVPGPKPPQNITHELGWEVGSHPPAPWFNWFFHRVFESLLELEAATLARVINEAGVPGIMAGRESERPAASPETVGRIFIAIDTKRMYRDRGNGWDLLNTPEAIGAETPDGAQAKAEAAAGAALSAAKAYADAAVAAHAERTDNPHQVTAAQLGLGDVLTNLAQILSSRIVEMGTNANGTYLCWENGLQVCWKRLDTSDFSTSDQTVLVQGLTYRYRVCTWTFPKPFAAAPVVLVSGDLDVASPESHGVYDVTTTGVKVEAGTLQSYWTLNYGGVLAIGLGK